MLHDACWGEVQDVATWVNTILSSELCCCDIPPSCGPEIRCEGDCISSHDIELDYDSSCAIQGGGRALLQIPGVVVCQADDFDVETYIKLSPTTLSSLSTASAQTALPTAIGFSVIADRDLCTGVVHFLI